jgi:tripartite-type tricarboxylate transporter receptor subunit TctC
MNRRWSKAARSAYRLLRCLAVLALAGVPVAAAAQSYPTKPVRIIVPYSAGGAVTLTARLIQEQLRVAFDQPVVVENRPGATGKLGAEAVARSQADGYTILYTVGGDLTLWQGKPDTPEAVRRLTPIAGAVNSVVAIATRPTLPVNSIADLLAYIKQNPGKLTYGSTGHGSFQHLMGEYLRQEGYEMLHVPYTGLAPVMMNLAGGQIDVAITNLATSLSLAKEGKIKLLAITQPTRFEGAPDVPSIKEALPTFAFPVPWYGFFGPQDLPRPIVTRLADEVAKALAVPDVKARLAQISMVPMITKPDQFATMIQDTGKLYRKIIETGKIDIK